MKYYIYLYLDQFHNPFYVGKGQNNRYKIQGHKNQFLQNKINKIGPENIKIHFIHQNLSEDQANLYEKVWIKLIGRRDLKQGPLCNMTDGGEGQSNPSKITRKKISDKLIGKPLSESTKYKMSLVRKGKKQPASMGAKLRKAFSGEKSNSAKLKNSDVLTIKKMTEYMDNKDIAVLFSISRQSIQDIRAGRTWKCLDLLQDTNLEVKYGQF